jgi:hypothetical protein
MGSMTSTVLTVTGLIETASRDVVKVNMVPTDDVVGAFLHRTVESDRHKEL